ncbi:MAG: galactose mutarotase-like domain-containing protein [Linnemannia gamsii]|nr:MAG: galactose mutarotase-like domain-containing protein [Linnemannia gamsii]
MPVKTTTLATEPVLVQQHELTRATTSATNNKEQTYSATILTYGATLTHLICPDRWNQPQDIVLGFDHWEDYLAQAQPGALNPYFGAIIGPTASRIANATFQLDSTHLQNNTTATTASPTTPTSPTATHVLQVSNGLDCHHGGPKGFDKQHWTTVEVNQEETSVTLEWVSPHGEHGYPGRLVSRVQYRWTDQGELAIELSAQLEEEKQRGAKDTATSMDLHSTIVSLTNHAYWNLDGVLNLSEVQADQLQSLLIKTPPISEATYASHKEDENVAVIKNPCSVRDHTLWLSTPALVELGNKHPVPTGVILDVRKTPELHVQKELLDFTGGETGAGAGAGAGVTQKLSADKNKSLAHGLELIPGGYGYDHVFALDGTDATHPTPVPVNDVGIQAYWPRTPHVATLYSSRSGIRLDLSTTEPALVLYASGYLDKSLLHRTKSKTLNIPSNPFVISPAAAVIESTATTDKVVKIEAEFDKFAGFCLEPIRYPDAIHHRDWAKMVTLHHDHVYRHRSLYKLSAE